jgi:hypothetical protein
VAPPLPISWLTDVLRLVYGAPVVLQRLVDLLHLDRVEVHERLVERSVVYLEVRIRECVRAHVDELTLVPTVDLAVPVGGELRDHLLRLLRDHVHAAAVLAAELLQAEEARLQPAEVVDHLAAAHLLEVRHVLIDLRQVRRRRRTCDETTRNEREG